MASKHHGIERPFWVDAIHTFALAGLTIAQPVYSSLAGGAEFFVAHGAGPLAVLALAACLSLGLPLAIIALESIVRWINRPTGRIFHLAVTALLLFSLALQFADRLSGQSLAVPVLVAAVLAALGTVLYMQSAVFNRILSILAIGAALFPLNFLLVSPVSRIVLETGSAALGEVSAPASDTPIVLVIFDEFNPTVLLDHEGKIDGVRYPHFAELASQSWWFPRATSTHPQTQFAVPAILTGKLPDENKQFPSYKDHPRNLFTMLGSSYSMNVKETLTSLCPDSLCKAEGRGFNDKLFASDILVVIGHSLLPRAFAAELLPPLDAGWNGFARTAAAKVDAPDNESGDAAEQQLIKAFGEQANRSRLDSFRDFISKSGAGKRHLDFLHVLLPHQPYEFLPSGTIYSGGPDIGFSNDTWVDDQNLVNLAYHRYMMQVGLVDTLIGELIAHLKRSGVYDSALIIVTGDHGRAFHPGMHSRAITQSNGDLLHIPLLIKMPGQKDGAISDILVSNMDILPTIAEALGIETQWDFDGESVFAKERQTDTSLHVSFKGENFIFDRNEIVRRPLLKWQSETFPSSRSVSELFISSPYSDLVGKNISSFEIGADIVIAAPFLKANLSAFANIDLKRGFLPALLQSEIEGAGASSSTWVALALNNRIVAVTPAYQAENGRKSLASLLPESAFRQGNNHLSAFFIEGSSQAPRLIPIMTNSETYTVDNGGSLLKSSGGKTYIVEERIKFGSVDKVIHNGSSLTLIGWSADTQVMEPVQTIVAFVDGKFTCATNPSLRRQDVANHFQAASVEFSGYSLSCPFDGSSLGRESLRVFGISPTGAVGELHVAEHAMGDAGSIVEDDPANQAEHTRN